MPAISSLIAATAVAVSAAGTAASVYGSSKQADAQAAAAQNQAQAAGIQAGATDLQNQSVQIQQQQQQLQIATQKTAIGIQQQEDDVRRQAATLDATRRQREIVRQTMIAKSASLVAATAQGASSSGSSALGGASGEISGRAGVNSLGISQQLQLGNSIFDLNKQLSSTYLNAQDQNSSLVAQGGTIQSQILAAQKQINQLGVSTALDYRDAAASGAITAFGSGLSSLGGAVVKNQDAIANIGTYFTSAFGSSSTSALPEVFNGVGSSPY